MIKREELKESISIQIKQFLCDPSTMILSRESLSETLINRISKIIDENEVKE